MDKRKVRKGEIPARTFFKIEKRLLKYFLAFHLKNLTDEYNHWFPRRNHQGYNR